MLTKIKMALYCGLSIGLLTACSQKPKNIPHFTISKIFRTDTLTTVDVHIANRMSAAKLLLIAGKLKADSTGINHLAIHYLLPGNRDVTSGDNSYYALASYVKDNEKRPSDTLKDYNGSALRLKIFGLDSIRAAHLLFLQPEVTEGKDILGKFIDDYSRTLIIPFTDPKDKKNEMYIVEVDSTGKVVSATIPQKQVEDGTEKWLVTQGGDYITLKDSVLTQYSSTGLGLPFNAIKSGI